MSGIYDETSDSVLSLVVGKRRISMGHYRLMNGWICIRNAANYRPAYWSIFADEKSVANHSALGGGEARLTRALANVLNKSDNI